MIVLSRSMKTSKMIILLLSTAVSLTIQAAVPNPRDFNFLIDSPSLTTEDSSSTSPFIKSNSVIKSLKEDEISTTLEPGVTSTISSINQEDISTSPRILTLSEDAPSTISSNEELTNPQIQIIQGATIIPAVMLNQDENISKDDSSITSFMLSNNLINQQIRENIEATTTEKIAEDPNTSTEVIVEDPNTSTEDVVDDLFTTTERLGEDLLTTIHTPIETTTLEVNNETTIKEINDEKTTKNTNEDTVTAINYNDDPTTTIVNNDDYFTTILNNEDPTATVVNNEDPTTTIVNNEDSTTSIVNNDDSTTTIVNNDDSFTTIANDVEIKTTTSTIENMGDTTLDISLAFKEIKPREELIAFNNHGTEKYKELTSTEKDEDMVAKDEELYNIFTESPTFATSFYDSFEDTDYKLTSNDNSEDNDYKLTSNDNSEESRSHETTSIRDDSFDKIMFTKDGIEPLDDSAFVLTNTHLMAALNDDAVIFTTDRLPALFGDEIYDDSQDYFISKDKADDLSIKFPETKLDKMKDENKIVDGFIISSKSQKQGETDELDYADYETDESLIQKALEEYDFSFTNNEDVTTVSPSDNEVDSGAIIDVLKNFIAEQDPILELFLSVCFVHPDCFQLDSPFPDTELGAQGREVLHLLQARRSETARVLLLSKIEQVVVKVKQEMFKAMEVEVAKRGVSISATKNIVDSIKNAWEDVRDDIQYAISSLHEIFSSDSLLANPDMFTGIAQIADTLTRIPDHVKLLYTDAAQNGYSRYQQFSAWNSWKREPKELKE